jgi:hypothetical protein
MIHSISYRQCLPAVGVTPTSPPSQPTAPPTRSPTPNPTPQPTKIATTAPTRRPTPMPTFPPVPAPTIAPIATPRPTPNPTKIPTAAPTNLPAGDGCCTHDYAQCLVGWCDTGYDACINCGNDSVSSSPTRTRILCNFVYKLCSTNLIFLSLKIRWLGSLMVLQLQGAVSPDGKSILALSLMF